MDEVYKRTTAVLVIPIICLFAFTSGQGNALRMDAKPIKDVKTELIVYEDKENIDGNKVAYTDYMDWFDDMNYLFRKNKWGWQPSWLCVESGVFILYKDPMFIAEKEEDVTVTFGENKCMEIPTPGLGAIRHAATKWLNFDQKGLITLFTELFYGGFMNTVIQRNKHDLSFYQPTQSLIVVGRYFWYIHTKSDKSFVVVPFPRPLDNTTEGPTTTPATPNKKDIYVCLVPNVTDTFEMGDDELDTYFDLVQLLPGDIEDDNITHIYLENCYDYYKGDLIKPGMGKPQRKKILATRRRARSVGGPVKPPSTPAPTTEDPTLTDPLVTARSARSVGGPVKPPSTPAPTTEDPTLTDPLVTARSARNVGGPVKPPSTPAPTTEDPTNTGG